MKKTIIIVILVTVAAIVLLALVPGMVERRLHSAAERIEATVEEFSPGLYRQCLQAEDWPELAGEYPELDQLMGNRLAGWQEEVDGLSLEAAVGKVCDGVLSRVRKIIIGLQWTVVALAVLVVAAVALYRRERTDASGGSSSSGVVFGE